MNEIICPNCKKAFKVDNAGYADIVKQVRDRQFDEEIKQRLVLAEESKRNAVKLAEAAVKDSLIQQISAKGKEIEVLKSQYQITLSKRMAEKEAELQTLKSKFDSAETEKKLAVNEATRLIEKERDALRNALNMKDAEKELFKKSLEEKFLNKLNEKDAIIKYKDEEIALRKDMKMRLSTKMIGETLEQHCETEFNKLRATAFPNAYFEKDNDARSGSKGDFIYRETDDAGNEIISIMFEMKNKGDETATKKRNEVFLNELDKDRNVKKCEYAVLVSLLEAESDYYNTGIVDVSHRYKEMYVVRPQFLFPSSHY